MLVMLVNDTDGLSMMQLRCAYVDNGAWRSESVGAGAVCVHPVAVYHTCDVHDCVLSGMRAWYLPIACSRQ